MLSLIVAVLMMTLWACGSAGKGERKPTRSTRADFAYHSYPGTIRSDCEVVARRCNKCHTLDRVLIARVESRQHWTLYVERMRRMSGSGISRTDATSAINCLSYRSQLLFPSPRDTPLGNQSQE